MGLNLYVGCTNSYEDNFTYLNKVLCTSLDQNHMGPHPKFKIVVGVFTKNIFNM